MLTKNKTVGGESHLFRYFSLHPDAGRYLLFSRFALVCPLSYRRYSIFTMFEKTHLIKLAQMKMPFGKYAGRALIDLPEPYLLWFANKKQFPSGELGDLMQLCLALKIEGLDSVVKPLKYEKYP